MEEVTVKKKKKSAGEEEEKKRKKLTWKGKVDSATEEKPKKPDSTPNPPTEPDPPPEAEIKKPKEEKKKPKVPKKVPKKPEPEEAALPEGDDTGCAEKSCPKWLVLGCVNREKARDSRNLGK